MGSKNISSFVRLLAVASLAPLGCGHGSSPGDASDAAVASMLDGAVSGPLDGGALDLASVDGTIVSGPPPSTLPVSFSRPDVGTPLSPAELTVATDELIAILKDTRYFDFVEERVHGWPQSDTTHAFWNGTWWSGITVTKTAGVVRYAHSADGADNNGLRTAPYLEGACYAQLMWGGATSARLVRTMTRGMSAWALGIVKQVGDTNPPLLARAVYPTSVMSTDGGRSLFIDYTLDRPGVDASQSSYVHLATNPSFGDVYIKNKRSKDDIGHMLRTMAQVQPCASRLGSDGAADLSQMMALYKAWAQRVDSQGFAIETLDTSGSLWTPPDMLAHYTLTANLECLGALAVRLMGGAAAGTLACGDGLPSLESTAWTFLKNDARQIERTNHAAALTLAYQGNQLTLAASLLSGLARRIELDLGVAEGASPPADFELRDVAGEVIYASNVGVPLTSREVRWLHARLHQAYVGMRDPSNDLSYHLFDAATPDGTYAYDAPDVGLFHRDVAMLLGACASGNRNPTGRAILDCAHLLAAF